MGTGTQAGVATITPGALSERIHAGGPIELIDVRTPLEYRAVHAAGARLVPLQGLDPLAVMRSRAGREDEPLYVICRSGSRGELACQRFRAAGFTNVVNVEGGTLAWEQAGLPVERGKSVIGLERQVRIAAGLLVLLGTALGAFLHPAFLGLSAFVGAGLVFAGVTERCGMALLLARMPWNQAGSEPADCTR
jgi:rhodanese-related sulfurtransferase